MIILPNRFWFIGNKKWNCSLEVPWIRIWLQSKNYVNKNMTLFCIHSMMHDTMHMNSSIRTSTIITLTNRTNSNKQEMKNKLWNQNEYHSWENFLGILIFFFIISFIYSFTKYFIGQWDQVSSNGIEHCSDQNVMMTRASVNVWHCQLHLHALPA